MEKMAKFLGSWDDDWFLKSHSGRYCREVGSQINVQSHDPGSGNFKPTQLVLAGSHIAKGDQAWTVNPKSKAESTDQEPRR